MSTYPVKSTTGLAFQKGDRVLDITDGSKGEIVGHQLYEGFGGWWWIVKVDGTGKEVEVRGQHLELLDRPLAREEAIEDHIRDMREPRPAIFGMIEAHVREDFPESAIALLMERDTVRVTDTGIYRLRPEVVVDAFAAHNGMGC